VARTGEKRKTHRVLMGKPERKRQLGISKSGWEDITMVFKEHSGKAQAGLRCLSIERSGGLL
jgi:hypothetical protein